MVARCLALFVFVTLSSCNTKSPPIPSREAETPAAKQDEIPTTTSFEDAIVPGPPENRATFPDANNVVISPNLITGIGHGGGAHEKQPGCGDREVQAEEECDDGNRVNNDGCNASCEMEKGFPLCNWQCDDPVCAAACEAKCNVPQCSVSCLPPMNPPNCECVTTCSPPLCEVRCPDTDFCETEHCPACETICEPPICATQCQKIDPNGVDCQNTTAECQIQCEPTICAWQCFKPAECPQPKCELQCERALNNCEDKQ